MPSPFPGMDPYLEGEVWSDLHQTLAAELRRRLVPQVRPKYTVRLVPRIEIEKPGDEDETAIVFPDTDVILARPDWVGGPATAGAATLAPPTATVPMGAAVRWKLVTVEVRERVGEELVTALEILPPSNKRRPGLIDYRRKRKRYWEQGANLVEIDLLRAGARPFNGPGMPATAYRVCVTPAGQKKVDVWAFGLRDPAPTFPVPLWDGDGPASLDLGDSLKSIYDEAGYDLRVNYRRDPPAPPLAADDAAFVARTLAPLRGGSGAPAGRDGD